MNNKITFKSIIRNLDAVITGTTLTICVFLVNANVIMRYFFNNPIRWSEEVVTSLFVWTVFIGSAYAYRKHAHLGVDVLVNLFPKNAKVVVTNIVRVLELLVLTMLTVISSQYVYNLIYNRNGKLKIVLTDMLRIPKWWTGIAVPIGFGLSVLYSLYFMYKDIKALRNNSATNTKEEGGAE